MRKPTVKEKLLRSLFKTHKTTRELAIELGYFDAAENDPNKKNPKYSHVEPRLKELVDEGYIEGTDSKKDESKSKRGNPSTIYRIIYDIPVLVKMMEKYPWLIPDMQKNENVTRLIVDKHKSALFDDLLQKSLQIPESNIGDSLIDTISSIYKDYSYHFKKEELEREFIKRLQWSSSYFKLYLTETTEKITAIGKELVANNISFISSRKALADEIRSKFFLPREMFVFDIIFEFYVEIDRERGNSNEQATEYLTSRNIAFKMFNDYTVDVMNKIFEKYSGPLEITAEWFDECSKEEIKKIYKFLLFKAESTRVDFAKFQGMPIEDLIESFKQLFQEGELDTFLKNREEDLKFINSL